MGDTTRITTEEIQRHLRFRAQLAVAGIATLGALGIVLIAHAVPALDSDRVCLIIGVGLCQAAVTMIVAWGASTNHGMVARLISDRFDVVEQIERETGGAIIVALDEVRERRNRRQG